MFLTAMTVVGYTFAVAYELGLSRRSTVLRTDGMVLVWVLFQAQCRQNVNATRFRDAPGRCWELGVNGVVVVKPMASRS